jgi:Holliday junction resolvase RusA-like endonuclease
MDLFTQKNVRQVIHGVIPSKSNCYRIVTMRSKDPEKKSHATLAKSKELKQYERTFDMQCIKYRNKNVSNEFTIEVDVYYPSRRADLDNSLKILLDCLQMVNAISNDNKCTRIVANRHVDPKSPRIEFVLIESFTQTTLL